MPETIAAKPAEFRRLATEAIFISAIKEIPSASAILHRARRKQRMGGGNRDKLISNRAPAHGRIGHAVAQDRSSKPPWHPAGMYARPTAVRRTEWHRE